MFRALLIALAICTVAVAPALAFHSWGVARCSGCHTMHNSQNGALVDPDSPNGNPWLLNDATPSDVCMNCHATRNGWVMGEATANQWQNPMNPRGERGPGNFIFLLEDNINDGHNGANNPLPGYHAGHSVISPGRGLAADGVLVRAPGGTYPASAMHCTSCHDPHGTNSYRLLYGAGRVVVQGNYTFTNPAPVAEQLEGGFYYGFSSSMYETNNLHIAYKSGMSAWCGNCHGNFHNNNTQLIHPSGRTLGGTIAGIYNRYNGTMDQTGGNPATAYLAAVPFEDPANTTTSTAGPSAASQISCISCHRAHATSARDAGRWDFLVQFMDTDGNESGSYKIPNPYPGPNQRSLCNKCHNKDEFDRNPY